MTREEFDEEVYNGTIEESSDGYWNAVPRKGSAMCMIDNMFQLFGREIPNYHDKMHWEGFGWNDWMVRPYKFKPTQLNDKIILNKVDKSALKEYHTKESDK